MFGHNHGSTKGGFIEEWEPTTEIHSGGCGMGSCWIKRSCVGLNQRNPLDFAHSRYLAHGEFRIVEVPKARVNPGR